MVYYCYTEAKRAADVKSAKESVITMEQTNCEKHYEIDEKSLLEEILITIGDYFSCTIVQEGRHALLSFENGQKFRLSTEKVL